MLRADTSPIWLFRVFRTCCEGNTWFLLSWLLIQGQDSMPLSDSAKYCHRVALTRAVSALRREHRKAMNSLGSMLGAPAEQEARTPAAGLSLSASCAHPPATATTPQIGSQHRLFILFLANHPSQIRAPLPCSFPTLNVPPFFLAFPAPYTCLAFLSSAKKSL